MIITFVAIEMDIRTGTDIRTVCLIIKFFGECFGISCCVHCVIGIYLSRSKNDKDMKCLWKGFITLVCLKSILILETIQFIYSVRRYHSQLIYWISC